MQTYIAIMFMVALLAACSSGDRTTKVDHSGHNMNANSSANTATIDHNSIGHGNSSDHSTMKSSPGASAAPYDLQFLDTMTAHHQAAVEMAMLADSRAERSEVKELAGSIMYDQEKEIGKMSEWRDRWFGEKPKAVNMEFAGMSHGMEGMDLTKLRSLHGKQFDVEFLKQMIPHHEGAIEMARDLQKQDANAELKQLAADIIAAQEAEIKQMREWLSRF